MSTQKRKISYWSFDFLSGDEHCFDPEVFCGFMAYLKSVDSQRLLHRDEKQNKAIALESIHEEVKQGLRLYKVIFKSCKYNHSPDYIALYFYGDGKMNNKCILQIYQDGTWNN